MNANGPGWFGTFAVALVTALGVIAFKNRVYVPFIDPEPPPAPATPAPTPTQAPTPGAP